MRTAASQTLVSSVDVFWGTGVVSRPTSFTFVRWFLCVWLFLCTPQKKDLIAHLKKLEDALKRHRLDGARYAVLQIVGREMEVLDKACIVRAIVESIAENYIDGSFAIELATLVLLAVSPLIPIPAVILVTVGAAFYRLVTDVKRQILNIFRRAFELLVQLRMRFRPFSYCYSFCFCFRFQQSNQLSVLTREFCGHDMFETDLYFGVSVVEHQAVPEYSDLPDNEIDSRWPFLIFSQRCRWSCCEYQFRTLLKMGTW